MSGFGRLVWRMIVVPFGYLVAVAVAVSLISTVSMVRAYGPVADDPALVGMTGMVVAADAAVLLWVLGGAALLPALAAAALAEAFSIRGWIYFALASIAVAGVVDYALDYDVVPGLPGDVATGTAAALGAGMAYWLVAGRGAGMKARHRETR